MTASREAPAGPAVGRAPARPAVGAVAALLGAGLAWNRVGSTWQLLAVAAVAAGLAQQSLP